MLLTNTIIENPTAATACRGLNRVFADAMCCRSADIVRPASRTVIRPRSKRAARQSMWRLHCSCSKPAMAVSRRCCRESLPQRGMKPPAHRPNSR